MIVPDIVKDKWKSQPTTVELLKVDLKAMTVLSYEIKIIYGLNCPYY